MNNSITMNNSIEYTERNLINNPWIITDSITSAVDKKDDLYSNWKSTCTKKDPDVDRSIHNMFISKTII